MWDTKTTNRKATTMAMTTVQAVETTKQLHVFTTTIQAYERAGEYAIALCSICSDNIPSDYVCTRCGKFICDQCESPTNQQEFVCEDCGY